MKHRQRGFTLIEVIIAALLLAMVVGSVFKLARSGQKSAMQVMQSHQINEEIQAAVNRFEDDVKESNVLLNVDDAPLSLDLQGNTLDVALANAIQGQTLKTDDPKNTLKLLKYDILSPNEVGTNAFEGCVKKFYVEYFFDDIGTNLKALSRKFFEIENTWDGTSFPPPVKSGTQKVRPVISQIDCTRDYLLFFRVVNSGGAINARNVYLTAELNRKDPKDKSVANKKVFSASVLVAAHLRGTAHN